MELLFNLDATQLAALRIDQQPFVAAPQAGAGRKACPLEELRTALASMPTNHYFGLLQAPFAAYGPATPVAVCHTATGIHLALFPELSAGQPERAPSPARRLPGMEKALFTSTLHDLAKQLPTALASEQLRQLVGQQCPLEQEFKVLCQYLGAEELGGIWRELLAARHWLGGEFAAALAAKEQGRGFGAAACHRQAAALTPKILALANTLERTLSKAALEECSFAQRLQVGLHAQLYAVLGLLYAAQLLCRTALPAPTGPGCSRALERAAASALTAHAQATIAFAERLREGRLGLIADEQLEQQAPLPGHAPGTTFYTWYWEDRFQSEAAADPLRTPPARQTHTYSDVAGKAADLHQAETEALAQVRQGLASHRAETARQFDERVKTPLLAVATNALAAASNYQRRPAPAPLAIG